MEAPDEGVTLTQASNQSRQCPWAPGHGQAESRMHGHGALAPSGVGSLSDHVAASLPVSSLCSVALRSLSLLVIVLLIALISVENCLFINSEMTPRKH